MTATLHDDDVDLDAAADPLLSPQDAALAAWRPAARRASRAGWITVVVSLAAHAVVLGFGPGRSSDPQPEPQRIVVRLAGPTSTSMTSADASGARQVPSFAGSAAQPAEPVPVPHPHAHPHPLPSARQAVIRPDAAASAVPREHTGAVPRPAPTLAPAEPAVPAPLVETARAAAPATVADVRPAVIPPEVAGTAAPAAAPVQVAAVSPGIGGSASAGGGDRPAERIEPPHFGLAYLDNPRPAYPPAARRLRLEGTVVVRVRVSPAGRAEVVELGTSSGASVLDDAALEAIRAWRFEPARRGDTPITHWAEVPVRFRLER